MGLDLVVMRPRKFFQRDFLTAVQRDSPELNVRVNGVSPMSVTEAEIAEVMLIKRVRRDQRDPRYVLPNDDAVYFVEQYTYNRFDLLREFAAFLDYPPTQYVFWGAKAFGEGYDLDKLPSIKAAWRRWKSSYPHLVFHEDTRGYYFPTTLDFPIKTEYGLIGSTANLRKELTALSAVTHTAMRHREKIAYAIELLMQAAEVSEKSGLPIIFDG